MDTKAQKIFDSYINLIEKETSIDEQDSPVEDSGWYSQMYRVWDFEEMNEDTNMDIPKKCMRVLKEKHPEIKELSQIQSEKGWWGIQFKL